MRNRLITSALILVGAILLVILGIAIGRGNNPMSALFEPPTPTLTPREAYAFEMKIHLMALQAWLDGPVYRFYDQFDKTDPETTYTYGDLVDIYALLVDSGTMSSMDGLSGLSTIHTLVRPVVDDGYKLYTALSLVTPPAEIKTAHDDVVGCVKYEIDRGSSLIELLEKGSYQEISSSCRFFKQALDDVLVIVKENGGQVPEFKNPNLLELRTNR